MEKSKSESSNENELIDKKKNNGQKSNSEIAKERKILNWVMNVIILNKIKTVDLCKIY